MTLMLTAAPVLVCPTAVLILPEPPDADTPTVAGCYQPTLADEWALLGFDLGRAGGLMQPDEAFPDASQRDMILGAFAFSEAMHAGFSAHVRALGSAAGLDGLPCERPESVPSRFADAFSAGWHQGAAERSQREAILAAYFRQLDREQAEWEWERQQRVEVCEAKGWPLSLA